MENSRDYARSFYETNTNIGGDFDDVSDLDESDEEELEKARVPSKANKLLGLGYDSPSNRRQDRRGSPVGVSTKAQKLLGLSKALKVVPSSSPARRQALSTISSDAESIAPKALRTLGLHSSQRSKPMDSPSSQGSSNDAENFKRMIQSGRYPQQVDNNSSTTDVSSSVSRESTISWRTETPRSSQEVHREDVRWRNRPPVFTKRVESLVNPSAFLTEPFSPLSAVDDPWNRALPELPNDCVFELPADMPPPPRYSLGESNFIAELPADTQFQPIYELPALEPEIAELPANMAELSIEKKIIAGLSIGHSLSTEFHSHSSDEKSIKAAGKLSSDKISSIPHRTMTAPTRRKGSISGKQAGRVPPISTDVGRRHVKSSAPTGTRSRQENTMSLDRNRKEQGGSYDAEDLSRSRSTEFEARSSTAPETPISPISSTSGLGKIAAKAAIGRRRHSSLTEEQRGKIKSKYTQKAQFAKRDLSSESVSSIQEESGPSTEGEDARSNPETTTRTTSSSEDYPESPVTGYIAGHPSINR